MLGKNTNFDSESDSETKKYERACMHDKYDWTLWKVGIFIDLKYCRYQMNLEVEVQVAEAISLFGGVRLRTATSLDPAVAGASLLWDAVFAF